jgi:capsule biosynthesis phosphatase
MTIYVFDIDGTICENNNGDYETAKPIELRIRAVNKLFDAGNTIILNTARGMGSNENNAQLATHKWRDLTIAQLNEWGVKYHEIYFGKPAGDIYIDDKGQSDTEFFNIQ